MYSFGSCNVSGLGRICLYEDRRAFKVCFKTRMKTIDFKKTRAVSGE